MSTDEIENSFINDYLIGNSIVFFFFKFQIKKLMVIIFSTEIKVIHQENLLNSIKK